MVADVSAPFSLVTCLEGSDVAGTPAGVPSAPFFDEEGVASVFKRMT